MDQTAYTFFGVQPTASLLQLQQAYQAKLLKYPVDGPWSRPMGAAARNGRQEVERWYGVIGTPEKRAAYDATLAAKRPLIELGEESSEPVTQAAELPAGQDDDSADYVDNSKYIAAGPGRYHDDSDYDSDDDDEPLLEKPSSTSPAFTLDDLRCATAGKFLYRTRTRTAITLALLSVAIFVVVYGSPSTWTIVSKVSLTFLFWSPAGASPSFVPAASPSPYAVLGLPSDPLLTTSQIRAAYHRAVLVNHPDKGGDTTSAADINSAYETLREPYARCLHHHALLTQWVCANLKVADESEDVEAAREKEDSPSPSAGSVDIPHAHVAVFQTLAGLWQRAWHSFAVWLGRLLGC